MKPGETPSRVDGHGKNIRRRFTSDIRYEWFGNPKPCTLNERRRRTGSGEILLDDH